jgi:hypothetical protein
VASNYLPLTGGTVTGQLNMSGNNLMVFGPNTGWSKYLSIGGNANSGDVNTASIGTTNGNLHIDAATNSATYLNYYKGTNGVLFGNGNSTTVAIMGPDGDLWKGASDNTGSQYWHAGNDGASSGLDADLLDGQHGSYFLDTSGSSQTKSGNLTVTGNISSGRYYQSANGIPTGNLGNPTVTEMALFDEQFYNQTAFYDITRLKFYSSTNGTTWTEITTITDGQKRTLVGGDNGGGVAIPNLTPYYRIEITNNGNYVFLNALYLYMTTSSHATSVKIRARRRSDLTFVNFATSNNTVNLWPGHVYLPFSTIPFLTGGSSSGHYDIVHIDFQPTWSGDPTYGTQPIFIQKLQIWGGYPAGKRNVFSTDENANVAFPAALTGSRLISNIATGTSPLAVTSTTLVTNLNADLLDGVQGSNYFRVDGTYPNTDMNTTVEGFWHVEPTAANLPIAQYGHRWDYDHLNNGQWVAQFYSATSDTDSLWFRQKRNYVAQPWQKLWSSTNDGTGSGLDADLLDGLHESSFIRSNADDTVTGTVDFTGGSGSVPAIRIKSGGNSWSEGLGIHPSADNGFALAVFRPSATLATVTNAWGIGNLGTNSTNNFGLIRNGLTGGVALRNDAVFDVTQAGVFRFGFNPTVGSNAIWHAGNDGTGSGLDADTVDGFHAAGLSKRVNLTGQVQTASFRKSVIALCELTNTNPSANSYSIGMITFHRTNGLDAPALMQIAMEKRYNVVGANYTSLVQSGDSFGDNVQYIKFQYNGVWYGGIEFFFSNAELSEVTFHGESNFAIFGLDYFNTQTSTVINSEINSSITVTDMVAENDLFINNNKVWNAQNDGSGSGLDADLLDGNHASAFYLATNPAGYTTNTGTVTSVTATAPIASSGGTAPVISINAATTSAAGSMSSADKTKLDGIATGAQVNVGTNLTWTAGTTAGPVVNSSTGTGAAIPLASATASGVLSNAAQTVGGDKTFTSRIITNDRVVIGDIAGYDVPYIAWGGSSNTYQLTIADYAYENPVIIDTVNAKVTAATFASNVATGTSPFTVASTTVVPSLNADLLDGNHASAFVLKSGDTINGNLTVNGNIINTGSTITVNTSNLTVTDKNIELGFITPKTGLVATLATGTPNITLTTGTTEGMIPGQALTKTSGTGVFGASARIATITGLTTLTATINHATAGSITFTASGATDFTADGGGITLKGDNDHRLEWNKNLLGNGAWTFSSDKLYLLSETTEGDKLVIEDTDLEEGALVRISSTSTLPNDAGGALLRLSYSATTSTTDAFIFGIDSDISATPGVGSTNFAYGGRFNASGADSTYGITAQAQASTSGYSATGLTATAIGVSGASVVAISASASGTSTSKYTFQGSGGTFYNQGSMGIGSLTPLNKLEVRITGADSDNGIMITRADTTTVTNEILGGIGFDSTDGNVPSSVLEASAYIAAFAAEDHSVGDKGGYLTFGTSPIDQDDDTVSTERMRIEAGGNIGIGTTTPSAKLDVAGDIEHTGLTMTSGTNVDQLKQTTFTSALTTAWTDVTGVSGTYLATGSHIVQIISNGEYYTGEMSWFSGTTTSTVADEIILHRAGPAASAGRIFARVIRTSSAPSTLKLQVSGSTSISSHTMTFKFRRTI